MPIKKTKDTPRTVAIKELKEYEARYGDGNEAGNIANRQKTVAKKAFVEFLNHENLPPGTIMRVEGIEYIVSASMSEKISAEKWYEKFKKKEMTKDQFLAAISVNKAEAGRIVGEDVVMSISEKIIGTSADLRRNVVDETLKGIKIIKPEVKTKKTKVSKLKTKRKIRLRADAA